MPGEKKRNDGSAPPIRKKKKKRPLIAPQIEEGGEVKKDNCLSAAEGASVRSKEKGSAQREGKKEGACFSSKAIIRGEEGKERILQSFSYISKKKDRLRGSQQLLREEGEKYTRFLLRREEGGRTTTEAIIQGRGKGRFWQIFSYFPV